MTSLAFTSTGAGGTLHCSSGISHLPPLPCHVQPRTNTRPGLRPTVLKPQRQQHYRMPAAKCMPAQPQWHLQRHNIQRRSAEVHSMLPALFDTSVQRADLQKPRSAASHLLTGPGSMQRLCPSWVRQTWPINTDDIYTPDRHNKHTQELSPPSRKHTSTQSIRITIFGVRTKGAGSLRGLCLS